VNLLEKIMNILSFQDWKEASERPGWAGRRTEMRHSRTPFAGRGHQYGEQKMTVEEFADKTARNERFAALRAKGTPHVSKFSTVRDNKSVWCVVRP
jgi:hypothetical protein